MQKLRVAINAQLMPDGPSGGIVTVLRALAAVTNLEGEGEEYVFVGPHGDHEWMRTLLAPGQLIVRGPDTTASSLDRLEPFKRSLGPLRPVARGVKRFLTPQALTKVADVSPELDSASKSGAGNGRQFFESLGCDVIHFPFQDYETCNVPSVYNPHDLQHLHLKDFFSATEVSRRESLYPVACHAANTVVVASEFVKRDVVERYGIEAERVQVIPWAPPPLSEAPDETTIASLQKKYDLGDRPFALYPAMTWEHKNHLRLLEAVASLRDCKGLDFRVVCTGFKTEFWPRIEKRLQELDLEDVVRFPGLIPLNELTALYLAAQFVIVPTLFEAASAPVFEAWQHGVPVACSRVTSLPEQVAHAALLFDPFSVNAISSALVRMSSDSALREELIQSGTLRLQDFSLERTAKAYRAVYRRAAGRELNEEDRWLLGCDWIRESEKSRCTL